MSENINVVAMATHEVVDTVRAALVDPNSDLSRLIPHRVYGLYRNPEGYEVWEFTAVDQATAETLLDTMFPTATVCGAWHKDGRMVGTEWEDNSLVGTPRWPFDAERWRSITPLRYDVEGNELSVETLQQIHRPGGWHDRRFEIS